MWKLSGCLHTSSFISYSTKLRSATVDYAFSIISLFLSPSSLSGTTIIYLFFPFSYIFVVAFSCCHLVSSFSPLFGASSPNSPSTACSFFQFTSYTYTIRLAFTLHPFSIHSASVSLVFPSHSRTIPEPLSILQFWVSRKNGRLFCALHVRSNARVLRDFSPVQYYTYIICLVHTHTHIK